jgi:hypothetical protein
LTIGILHLIWPGSCAVAAVGCEDNAEAGYQDGLYGTNASEGRELGSRSQIILPIPVPVCLVFLEEVEDRQQAGIDFTDWRECSVGIKIWQLNDLLPCDG